MPRPQFTLRALLVAIGCERADRKVWLVAFGATVLGVSCFAFMAFVVGWLTNPGSDHYAKIEQLKADFDSVHLVEASDLFTKLRSPLSGPPLMMKGRKIFAATRRNELASLYLQDAYGEFWKVTPERLFAPFPGGPTAWRHHFRGGVLSGSWEFTATVAPGSPLPAGSTVVVRDEFSIVLDGRNRMK